MEGYLSLHNLVDLHIHLGAATTPHFLWELAHDQGIRLGEKNYWKFIDALVINKPMSSKQYLKRTDIPEDKQVSPFVLTQKIQSSPYAVEKCVHEAISYAYRKVGVTRIELRFNPMFRNRSGEQDLDKIILAATIGLQKACLEYPVKAGLILETDRQFSVKQHEIIAKKAVAFKNFGVVGFDVSGPSPKDFAVKNLSTAVNIVKKAQLGVTIHTGEFTSSKEIWEVVQILSPDRIGHGIRAIDDAKLMKKLSRDKTVLEICPTSNIKTEVVKNWREMKKIIQTFKEHGVLFTINSDGPVFLGTTVEEELNLLVKHGILTGKEVTEVIRLAHNASFI